MTRVRRLVEIPRSKTPNIVDHPRPDPSFDRDEEDECRAARSLASRHRSLFLPEKKIPRF
jgi:hypothetical protein